MHVMLPHCALKLMALRQTMLHVYVARVRAVQSPVFIVTLPAISALDHHAQLPMDQKQTLNHANVETYPAMLILV
jgi:hypothetical protein